MSCSAKLQLQTLGKTSVPCPHRRNAGGDLERGKLRRLLSFASLSGGLKDTVLHFFPLKISCLGDLFLLLVTLSYNVFFNQ